MKRYFFLILAAGAAAVSCEREEAPIDEMNTVERVDLVISALPQKEQAAETRTTLVNWSYIICLFLFLLVAKFERIKWTRVC